MIITVDIGNSNTVFGVFKKNKLVFSSRFVTKKDITSDELAIKYYNIFRFYKINISDIKAVVIANVVPSLNNPYRDLIKNLFKCSSYFVQDYLQDLPINIAYKNIYELGDDRIVNAIAGYYNYQDNLIIIDFGTAITFDIVNRNQGYVGGVIYPGINLAVNYLSNETAKLPKVELRKVDNIIGGNTVHAIESGLFYGYIAMLEGVIGRIRAEQGGRSYKVIATGGVGNIFCDYSDLIEFYDPDLTLYGLKIMYNNIISDAD